MKEVQGEHEKNLLNKKAKVIEEIYLRNSKTTVKAEENEVPENNNVRTFISLAK